MLEKNDSNLQNFDLIDKASCFIQQIRLKISYFNEIEIVCSFITKLYPDSDKIFRAVKELVTNSMEYGLYNINSEKKSKLILQGKWYEELDRLDKENFNKNESKDNKDAIIRPKCVIIDLSKDLDKIILNISDPGKGFDWKKFLNFNPASSNAINGRGIAVAKSHFTNMKYNDKGNLVVAVLDLKMYNKFKW